MKPIMIMINEDFIVVNSSVRKGLDLFSMLSLTFLELRPVANMTAPTPMSIYIVMMII
jgi:hypothetical protein